MNAKLKPIPERVPFRAERVFVTPDMARRFLEGHENYRPLNAERVKQYAGDMKSGHWPFNGQTIAFDWHNKLGDGNTRLHACISADAGFETVIVWGIDPAAFVVTDRHRPRSLRDELRHRGYSRGDLLAAALPFVWTWEKLRMLSRDTSGHPSTMVLLQCLDRNPTLPEFMHESKSLRELGLPNALTSSLRYILVKSSSQEVADQFLGELGIGEMLAQTNPVFQLRKRLQKDAATNTTKLKKRPRLALITKAWNMWLAGEECMQLKWTSTGPGSEPFPKVATQQEVAAAEQAG